MFNAVVPTNSGDWSVVVCSRVGSDPANDGGSCSDWAQRHATQCLGCCVILIDFFLHFECEVEAVGIFEGGIIVVDELTVFEESKVSESKDFSSSFFLLWDFDVLTRTHGKEEGKNGEL
jgi:hypothetical protein